MAVMTSNADYGVFTTISLIDTYSKRWPVPSFMRDTFFGAKTYADSELVEIDSRLGGKLLAPFILPLENQIIGRRRPFKQSFLPAPIIAPARVITPRELTGPTIGETPYNYKDPLARFASILAEDGLDMDEEISRTEEWMCCQCMFAGKIPLTYRTATPAEIDYGFTNFIDLTKPWTDPTAFPLDDLRKAQGSLNANGYSGDLAIYSPEAWEALWANPSVKESMKNVFPQFVPIAGLPGTTEIPPAGVQRGPGFIVPPMENWIYYATYSGKKGGTAPDAGVEEAKPFIPTGSVLVGSRDIANPMVYGMVIQIEQVDGRFHSYQLDRVPKLECNVNKNLFMQTITSRPVPVPIDLLSWSVIRGAA